MIKPLKQMLRRLGRSPWNIYLSLIGGRGEDMVILGKGRIQEGEDYYD
jgi:hypothetical protein